jgi:tetratricopeptide (TPR) repeat protein
VRATFGGRGGVEVDAQGDAFFYAFARAGDAVAAAEQVQAALATGPIRIRIGVHTGEPTVTADGYVGVDVHKGARIAAVGHGGQTLLSEQTARLATGVTKKDMGRHRLKDLLGAERLYQLGEDDFPPLTSLHRLNLPAQATPFLGRAAELGDVTEALRRSDVRLVTLTGPGGTGKTRLALQAAADLADEFQDHLGRALATSGADPSRARAGALWGVGLLATLVGDHERAGASLDESLVMARAIGDSSCEGRCLVALGLLALFRDNVPLACSLLRDGALIARRCGDLWCLADALGTLGSVLPLQGALDEARVVGAEALVIARREGDRQGIRMALFGLAVAAVRKGDLDSAASEALEGVSICRAIGDPWFVSYFLWVLALVKAEQGAIPDARDHAEESLSVAREAGGALLVVCALEVSAAVSRAVGELDRASEFLAEAAAVVAGGNVPASYASAAARERGLLDLARGDAPGALTSLEGSLALARRCGDRWAEGRALASLARATGADGDSLRARALADQAMLLQQETGDRLGLAESRRISGEFE